MIIQPPDGLLLSRRRLIGGLCSLGSLALAGCTREAFLPPNYTRSLVGLSDALTMSTQRLLLFREQLAPEYGIEDISPSFPAEGMTNPPDEDYQRLLHGNFVDWRLPVTGLVARPLSLSLAQLQRYPSRTQITSHSCELGWTAIGQWTGVQLSRVLKDAGLLPQARYIVFDCVDGWYDCLDLVDAFHPQTLLAYGMNGKPLPVGHGAPVRLRVERHLGYKSVKFVKSIEAVASLAGVKSGKGSRPADNNFSWYAGI